MPASRFECKEFNECEDSQGSSTSTQIKHISDERVVRETEGEERAQRSLQNNMKNWYQPLLSMGSISAATEGIMPSTAINTRA